MGSACLVFALLAWWRAYPTAGLVLSTIGALLVGFGLAAPSALRAPNRVWWRFAQVLGWVNARILLTVFFALVLTPVGVVMRLFGRSPLRVSRGPTNWSPYPARHANPKHYERMF